jgi:hypothetical protein
MKILFLIVIFSIILIVNSQKCPKDFEIPDRCFSLSDIDEYADFAINFEKLNREFLKLLSDANFLVDGNKVMRILFNY